MASLEKLIEDYMDAAVGPEDMQQLALLQLANASVQDDAVGRAAQNLQGVEKANRSALENYMMAQDEMAQAEADKAVEYASKRLSEITQSLTMFGTVAGLSKAQKEEMEALKKERDKILKAFPQLGFAADGVASEDVVAAPAKFSNDMTEEEFIEMLGKASNEELSDYINSKYGRIPESFKEMISYKYSQSPELSEKVKTNPKLRGLYSVIGSGSLGDAQAEAARKKKAAEKAKLDAEEKKTLSKYEELKNHYLSLTIGNARLRFLNDHPEFKQVIQTLDKNGMLKNGAERAALTDFI